MKPNTMSQPFETKDVGHNDDGSAPQSLDELETRWSLAKLDGTPYQVLHARSKRWEFMKAVGPMM